MSCQTSIGRMCPVLRNRCMRDDCLDVCLEARVDDLYHNILASRYVPAPIDRHHPIFATGIDFNNPKSGEDNWAPVPIPEQDFRLDYSPDIPQHRNLLRGPVEPVEPVEISPRALKWGFTLTGVTWLTLAGIWLTIAAVARYLLHFST